MEREIITITRPQPSEYPERFAAEIGLAYYNDLISGLRISTSVCFHELEKLSDEQLHYRYAEGKWNIKEIWQHVIDVERILGYRALRYARQDETVLSGFDQDKYVKASNAEDRHWIDIISEYHCVRDSTIALFESFTPAMLDLRGTTAQSTMTVRSVGFLILGHEIHHFEKIKERYQTS